MALLQLHGMSWQIYLTVSIVLLSCNGLFHRTLLKDEDSSTQAQTILFLSLGGVMAIIIAWVQGKLNLRFPVEILPNLIILMALLTPAYLLKYRGFQLIGASEVVMFSMTGRLWSVIGAVFFLHENLTVKMILGIILIIGGVMFTRYENRMFVYNKGIGVVLLSAALAGIGDINGFYILNSYDPSNYLIYFYLLPVLTLICIQPKSILKLKYYFRKDRAIKMGILSLCDTFGMLTLYMAYQAGGQASVITPLKSLSILVTVMLAAIILKERDNMRNKLAGIVVAICGVFLLL